MKKEERKILGITLRYVILLLIVLPGFILFYFVFSPLTIYSVYGLLELIYHVNIYQNMLSVGNHTIEIINACIAGAAYYFLLVLNMSIPNVKAKKRIYMILVSFGIFLIINILRIFILSIMYISDSTFFDVTHKIFWYLGSTVLVVLIWILVVRWFKIKEIPIYSDFRFLYKKSLLKIKRKKN